MKTNAVRRILSIQPYRPGKPIDEVKRELGLKHVVKLASNENPYGPSPKVLRAICKEARRVNRYPDAGCFYLRQVLSKKLNVPGEKIVFGNGSDEIIVTAIRAFIREGDEVIVARPSFLIYDIASRIAGAKVRAIPLKEFRYDLDGMLKAVNRRTKIVFIGNPDNPAGTFVTRRQLEEFLKKLRPTVLVFLDEAYFEYVVHKEYPDGIALSKKYKNVIAARTFSKMYGLAGLRIGYGVADEEIIDIFNRVREPFNVNSLAQAAAAACLQDEAYYRRIAGTIAQQRRFLYDGLQRLNLQFVRTATNFILIDTRQPAGNVVKKLLQKGIIVRDMSSWGLDTYIRVTIGKEEENRQFLRSLKRCL